LAALKGRVGAKLWSGTEPLEEGDVTVVDAPEEGAQFAALPKQATKPSSYTTWQKAFKTHLYQHHTMDLWRCPSLKFTADPEESEAEFRIRVREAVREKRDNAMEKLRKKYAPKVSTLQERIRKAEEKVGRETSQYDQQKMQTAISMGATVLGALFGRKLASVGTVGRASTAARGVGRAAREKDDIERAKRDLSALNQRVADLEDELAQEVAALGSAFDPEDYEITSKIIRPRKADISVGNFGLVWLPHRVTSDGTAEPAY
jgi:hypothetical protein